MLSPLDLADGIAAAELLALQRASFRGHEACSVPPMTESLPDLIDSDETVLAWREGGELRGAIAYRGSLVELEVTRLAVHPGSRRRGIGSKLLHAVLFEAGPRPVQIRVAKANADGLAFCDRMGFHVRNEVQLPQGMAAVQLQRLAERP